MNYEQFPAKNGSRPDFGTNLEAVFAYHHKLIASCVEGRGRAQEQAVLAERESFEPLRLSERSA